MSDDLVDSLVASARSAAKASCTPRSHPEDTLLDRLTDPVLTDVAVAIVRAILQWAPPGETCLVVTPRWTRQIRRRVEEPALTTRSGLGKERTARVLDAMLAELSSGDHVVSLGERLVLVRVQEDDPRGVA